MLSCALALKDSIETIKAGQWVIYLRREPRLCHSWTTFSATPEMKLRDQNLKLKDTVSELSLLCRHNRLMLSCALELKDSIENKSSYAFVRTRGEG